MWSIHSFRSYNVVLSHDFCTLPRRRSFSSVVVFPGSPRSFFSPCNSDNRGITLLELWECTLVSDEKSKVYKGKMYTDQQFFFCIFVTKSRSHYQEVENIIDRRPRKRSRRKTESEKKGRKVKIRNKWRRKELKIYIKSEKKKQKDKRKNPKGKQKKRK